MRLADRVLKWNALAGRYAFSQLRPRNLAIALGIYGSVLAVTALALLLEYDSPAEYARGFYGFLVALQVFMLAVLGLWGSSSIMTEEAEDRSLDFFRLLPLNSREKISGLLFGRNLTLLLLAAFNAALIIAAGIVGRVPFPGVVQALALVTAAGGLCMMGGLLASIGRSRLGSRNSSVALLIACVFILPYLLALGAMWDELFPEGAKAFFYGFPLPLLALVTGIIAYFDGWLYAGLVRRFRNERQPLFSPAGSVAFMAGFLCLLVGLFWKVLGESPPEPRIGLWFAVSLVSVPALVLLALGSSRSWENYAEEIASGQGRPGLLSRRANLAPSALNLALWMIPALCLLPPGGELGAAHVLAMASFWLVFLLLIEAILLGQPLTVHVKWLGLVAAALYMILPPLVAEVTGAEILSWFGPVSFQYELGSRIVVGEATPFPAGVPILNLLFCLLLAAWIRGRYRVLGAGSAGGLSGGDPAGA